MAVDYNHVVGTRAKVQNIADAAALAAVNESTVRPTLTWPEQKEESEKVAKATFEALKSVSGLDEATVTATYEITTKNNIVTAKVCFSGTQNTMTLAVGGIKTISFSDCGVANSAPPVFVTVYVLADASGSMGIGASTSDQVLMNNKLGCAFACHTLSWKVPIFNRIASRLVVGMMPVPRRFAPRRSARQPASTLCARLCRMSFPMRNPWRRCRTSSALPFTSFPTR